MERKKNPDILAFILHFSFISFLFFFSSDLGKMKQSCVCAVWWPVVSSKTLSVHLHFLSLSVSFTLLLFGVCVMGFFFLSEITLR